MFIPSTFKRPVSSWKALNLRKTLLMASSVRSEERFSRNAETELVCRLLLEKKNTPAGTISAPASITSSRRMRDEGEIFRLGTRAGRHGGGDRRAAGRCAHGERFDRLAVQPRRGLRLRLRKAEGDPRCDRPRPCQAR